MLATSIGKIALLSVLFLDLVPSQVWDLYHQKLTLKLTDRDATK